MASNGSPRIFMAGTTAPRNFGSNRWSPMRDRWQDPQPWRRAFGLRHHRVVLALSGGGGRAQQEGAGTLFLNTQPSATGRRKAFVPATQFKRAKSTFQFHSSKKSAQFAISPANIIQPLLCSCVNQMKTFLEAARPWHPPGTVGSGREHGSALRTQFECFVRARRIL